MTAIKSVFSLMALLMLATLITGASSFQTTLAQPIMGDSNRSMGYGGAGTNFNPMSFANNLFNASSLYGSVGISMVNGVKVTSISLLENNEIAVTLRHSAAADTATSNNINASTISASSPRVTVTAIRAPMNLKDLLSLASQSSSNSTSNVNPLSFLTALQIGSSSTIANADWKLPQIVRMGLTGMLGGTNNGSTASTSDFMIVTVIPYTGKPTSPAGG